MRTTWMTSAGRALVAGLAALHLAATAVAAQATPGPQGRVAGRVTDKATGRPLVSVRVRLVGRPGMVETDLDGRFRTPLVPAGRYGVAAALIGYRPSQIDSVTVADGQTVVVSFALESSPVQLEELTVASDKPVRVSSSAGLLAAQQNAMAVVDGVSAEAISKTPDSDAGQAVTRVTGLAVVENKVVVRGLAERYSTSLLNGVEIASPEPDRKFVPLDVFASGLLESIVAAKTATPDRPGDFAGGIVDVQTKEFPDNFVLSFGVSQGYNDRSTFKRFARGPRSGKDLLGFDGVGRGFSGGTTASPERFAESLRNVWTPGLSRARPNLGLNAAVGGRKDLGNDAFGYVLSIDYGNGRDNNPDRYDAEGSSPILFNEAKERVELSGLLNLAYRSGAGSKFGLKNFYSRSSTEVFRSGIGGDTGEGPSLNYQGQFLEQFIAQTQLTGDHYLGAFLKSRLEWKGSIGQAGRDDLDNRQLRYVDKGAGYALNNGIPSYRYNTTLTDKSYTGQADWSIPFSLRGPQDGLFKLGGSYRRKDRTFGAAGYEMRVGSAIATDLLTRPPEELLAPENLGPGLISYQPAPILVPYDAREEVKAGYLMSDFEILPSVRIVGGARVEQWTANLTEANDSVAVTRNNRDILWSANLTYSMTPKINFRLAGYKTVARPDLRELSSGGYTSVVGGTVNIGNPDLKRSSILNADARFEVYPGADELVAVSVFYKRFNDPIITTYRYAGGIVILPDNGKVARSYGAEFEIRKNLGFLSGRLSNVLANANLTLLESEVRFRDVLDAANVRPAFQGQSPYLINAGLTYNTKGLSLSALFNRFGDRIERYPGIGSGSNSSNANVVEKARSTLDGKIKWAVRGGWSLSLTGKNLLNTRSEVSYDHDVPGPVARPILGRSLDGVSVSMGISYAR